MINWRSLAKLKIFRNCAIGWASFTTPVMLICLNFGYQLSALQIALLYLAVVFLAYIDMLKIVPEEWGYYFSENPEWKRRNDNK